MKTIKELFDLSGRVAVVTGAAAGIGKGIALRLAEAGAGVIVSDINFEEARATAAEITAAGGQAKAVACDTCQPGEAEKAIQEAVASFGDIDILVNNAGIYPFAPAADMPEAIWDKTIAVNLKGVMFFAQAAARAMVARGHGGKIVNVASVDAFRPTGCLAAYDASKGGVVMLTKALAKEWGPLGIVVNAVAPGAVQTPGATVGLAGMSREQIEEATKTFLAKIPLGRQGVPDDIAKVVLFLSTEAADYLNGAVIVADGGYLVG